MILMMVIDKILVIVMMTSHPTKASIISMATVTQTSCSMVIPMILIPRTLECDDMKGYPKFKMIHLLMIHLNRSRGVYYSYNRKTRIQGDLHPELAVIEWVSDYRVT